MFKNLNLIYESMIISFKSIKEYKSNFFMGFISHIGYTSMWFISLYVLKTNFSDIFPLTLQELIFFAITTQIFTMAGYLLSTAKIRNIILSGDLNIYLSKPKNVYLQSFLKKGDFASVIITFFIDFLFLIIFFIINPELFFGGKFITLLVFGFLGSIFFGTLFSLAESTAFIILENNFIKKLYFTFQNTYYQFPNLIFEGFLKFIGFLVPVSFFGVINTLYYFGYLELKSFLLFGLSLVCLILVFTGLIYLLWKFGLKKYEAYN